MNYPHLQPIKRAALTFIGAAIVLFLIIEVGLCSRMYACP